MKPQTFDIGSADINIRCHNEQWSYSIKLHTNMLGVSFLLKVAEQDGYSTKAEAIAAARGDFAKRLVLEIKRKQEKAEELDQLALMVLDDELFKPEEGGDRNDQS